VAEPNDENANPPHDQLGDLYNPPWAGLWMYEHESFEEATEYPVGCIVVIQPREVGSVDLFEYDTDTELRAAWLTMEQTIERTTGLANGENPG
jgi:hypothetical protein